MKILAVQETDWLKRGPHQQHHLFERLSLRGHEIRVIDYDYLWREEEGPLFIKGRRIKNVSKYYEGSSVEVIRPPIIRLPLLDLVSILLFHPYIINKQFRDYEPDVVIGFGILNTFFAHSLSKVNGVPFVYYLIDSLHTLLENPVLEPFAKFFERTTLRNSKHILTINQALRNYTIEMGADPENVRVIPAGIDLHRFENINNRDELREKLGIKNEDIVLFFMGWLYKFSGILEVAKSIKEGNNSFKLLVAGDGDIYEELNKMSKENNNIILTGRVPYKEIPGLLACSDICLLPAYNNKIMADIVPIKIYEYMASSKPIIATELNGLIQEFGHDSGIIYVKDPKKVLDTAKNIISNNLIHKLQKETRSYIKNNDWSNIVSTFENYLQDIADFKIENEQINDSINDTSTNHLKKYKFICAHSINKFHDKIYILN